MEQPQRNVINNLSNGIYYQDCATVCAQLSHTDSLDVWSFDAASDVLPTQLQSQGRRKREKEIGWKGTETHRENTTAMPQRERVAHSVTQSLALQMLAIGSVNGPHAYSLNPSIVRGLRGSLTVRQSGSGERIQRSVAVGIHCGYVWDSRLSSYHSQMSN